MELIARFAVQIKIASIVMLSLDCVAKSHLFY